MVFDLRIKHMLSLKFLNTIVHWQNWHYHIKYLPILPVWIWYCIKSRSLWFFSNVNPGLTLGGMDGETKEEMYMQLPANLYPKTIFVNPGEDINSIQQKINDKQIFLPFVVKPNEGMSALMFRVIKNFDDFKKYHSSMDERYLIQEFLDYPMEVSVFYYRMPNEKSGTVSGFLSKEWPFVTGDGNSSLKTLIYNKFKNTNYLNHYLEKFSSSRNIILQQNEVFKLSDACNRGQGGQLICLKDEIDDKLLSVFDSISYYNGNFLYGRYDIKCNSVQELKEGKNFKILEFNGSGSGTQHIYARKYSLSSALNIILNHWKALYTISKLNNERGLKYCSFSNGLKTLLKAKRNLKELKRKDLALNF